MAFKGTWFIGREGEKKVVLTFPQPATVQSQATEGAADVC